MAKALETIGVLTQVDKAAFAGYCQAYARWREAEEFLSKHGTIFKTPSGYIQQVPQVAIARNYLQTMKDFCSEFGLTPASRTRIKVEHESIDSNDPMDALLRVSK